MTMMTQVCVTSLLLILGIFCSPACARVQRRCSYFLRPDRGVRSIVMSVSVCLCVCWSVRDHISTTTRPNFTKFFVHVSYRRGSVLLWRRSDILRISGF